MKRFASTFAILLFAPLGVTYGQSPTGNLSYARDILPILSTHCFTCHGPDQAGRKAGLRLDTVEGATGETRNGVKPIVPGRPEASELVRRIFSADKDRMPPPKMPKGLSALEKETLKKLVEQGAVYQKHWAFDKPQALPRPNTSNPIWARNPIDDFVLAKLDQLGWKQSPEADRYALARRVAIDLTGLPPKLEQVDRFVNDKRPDAYEKFIDEVLRSPAYGERWAALWLDLARYADSNGYAEDQARTIWKYRDWVVQAFNDNQPYDQFTIDQIAGDMRPKPSINQILATAFNRNTLTNTEGGTSDEEFRNIAVVDRVNTTLQVWMGITVNCAQCHQHKYDPISQDEYFQLFAIFNQTEDADRSDNSPNLPYLPPEDKKKKAAWDTILAGAEKLITDVVPDVVKQQQAWEKENSADAAKLAKLPMNVQAALKVAAGKRNLAQKEELAKYFRSSLPEIAELQTLVTSIKAKLATVPPVPTPIMKELPRKAAASPKFTSAATG